jgi:hypothetical protein
MRAVTLTLVMWHGMAEHGRSMGTKVMGMDKGMGI